MNVPLEPFADVLQRQEDALLLELECALAVDCDLILHLDQHTDVPPKYANMTAYYRVWLYAKGLHSLLRQINRYHALIRVSRSRGWIFGSAWSWFNDDNPAPPITWIPAPLPPPYQGRPTIPRLRDGTPIYEAVLRQVRLVRSELDRHDTAPVEALLP